MNPRPLARSPRIRFSRPEDEEQLLAIKCEVFEGCRLDRERRRWRWEFEDNPAARSHLPRAAVVEEGPHLYGYFAFVPYRMQIGSDVVSAGDGIDLCITDQARGLGLAHPLVATLWDEGPFEFPFTAGINRASRHLFSAHGATLIGGQDDPIAFVYFLHDAHPPCPKVKDITVQRVDEFDEREDALWQRIRKDHSLILVRDAASLNWRYRDYPFQECLLLRATAKDGASRGIAVVQFDPARQCWYLLELLHDSEDSNACLALLVAAREAVDGSSAEALYYSTRWQPQHAPLQAADFRPLPGDVPNFMGKLPEQSPVSVRDWYTSLGDGDPLFEVGVEAS